MTQICMETSNWSLNSYRWNLYINQQDPDQRVPSALLSILNQSESLALLISTY